MPAPHLSAVMIAKNEVDNIERCLDSLWDAVDEIVLVDTGSRDGTLPAARKYAKQREEPAKLVIGRFKWCDDWASARNHADSLASGDWLVNMDADETLEGGSVLREIARTAPPETAGFAFRRVHQWTSAGACLVGETMIRLVRAGAGAWSGIVDEARLLDEAAILYVPPTVCEWVHHRAEHDHAELRATVQDPCEALLERAESAQHAGNRERAIELYREVLGKYGQDLAPLAIRTFSRILCALLIESGAYADARATARSMIRRGLRGDGNIVLAEVAGVVRDMSAVVRYAKAAVKWGEPNQIAPLDHVVTPTALLAVALAALGRTKEAQVHAREVLAVCPEYPGMEQFR